VQKFGRVVAASSNVSDLSTTQLSEVLTVGRTAGGPRLKADPQQIIDSFLAVEAKNAISESDLANIFKQVGPLASTAGISFDELNAISTIIKERTRSASGRIARTLRFVVKNLFDERKRKNIKAEFGEDAIQFTTKTGDLRRGFDVLKDLSKLFPTLNKRQKVFLAQQIGGTRFTAETISLFEGFGKAGNIVSQSQDSAGTTMERNAIMMQSLQKQVSKTTSAFEGMSLAVGSNFVEPAKVLLKTMQKIFSTVQSISEVEVPFLSSGSPTTLGPGGKVDDSSSATVGSVASSAAAALALAAAPKFLGFGKSIAGKLTGSAAGKAAAGTGTAAAASTGKSALSALAKLGKLNKGLAGGVAALVAFKSGIKVALGKIIGLFTGTTIQRALRSGVLSLFRSGIATKALGIGGSRAIGIALGGVLGGLPGLIVGALAGGAITSALSASFSRMLESSQERSQRVGLVADREQGAARVSLGESIQSQLTSLDNLDKKINKQSGVSTQDQKELVRQGRLDDTSADLERRRAKILESLKEEVIGSAASTSDVADILSSDPNVKISDQGELQVKVGNEFLSITDGNTEALRELSKILREVGSKQQKAADFTTKLNAFGENLGNKRESDSDVNTALGIADKLSGNVGGLFFKGNPELTKKEKLFRNSGKFDKTMESLLSSTLSGFSSALQGSSVKEYRRLNQGKLDVDSIDDILNVLPGGNKVDKIRSSTDTGNLDFTELKLGVIAEAVKENITDSLSNASEDASVSFNHVSDPAEDLKKKLNSLKVGQLVELFDKEGKKSVGRVVEDIGGELGIQLFKSTVKTFKESKGGLLGLSGRTSFEPLKDLEITVAESSTKTIDQAFKESGAVSGQIVTIDTGELKKKITSELGLDTGITGFGAGATLEGVDSFKSGADSILSLSDRMAGTFTGTSEAGLPQFNSLLQGLFKDAEEQQGLISANIQKGITDQVAVDAEGIKETAFQLEGVSVLEKAVAAFGKVVKTFEASANRLEKFRISKQVAKDIPLTQTGPLSKIFGGDILPDFRLGKEKTQLTARERAATQLPKSFEKLSLLQKELSSFREITTNIRSQRGEVIRRVRSARPESLDFNFTTLEKMLNNADAGDVIPSIKALFDKRGDEVGKGELSASQLQEKLISTLTKSFKTQEAADARRIDVISPQAKQLETSLKTAISLSQLQISAEKASKSLERLKQTRGLFDNLNRALGEGPEGVLGESQPTVLSSFGGGASDATQLDFRGLNRFEQQRRMIELRSSEDVRSGFRKLFDEGGNEITSLNDDQRRFELKKIKREEKSFSRGTDQGRNRKELSAQRDVASGFISDIDTLLKESTLTDKSKSGLQILQNELLGLSERPSSDFVDRKGKVNLTPFNILKTIPDRIGRLMPKDLSKGFDTLSEDAIRSLAGSGAISKDVAKGVLQSRSQQSMQPVVDAAVAGHGGTHTRLDTLISKLGTDGTITTPQAGTIDSSSVATKVSEAAKKMSGSAEGKINLPQGDIPLDLVELALTGGTAGRLGSTMSLDKAKEMGVRRESFASNSFKLQGNEMVPFDKSVKEDKTDKSGSFTRVADSSFYNQLALPFLNSPEVGGRLKTFKSEDRGFFGPNDFSKHVTPIERALGQSSPSNELLSLGKTGSITSRALDQDKSPNKGDIDTFGAFSGPAALSIMKQIKSGASVPKLSTDSINDPGVISKEIEKGVQKESIGINVKDASAHINNALTKGGSVIAALLTKALGDAGSELGSVLESAVESLTSRAVINASAGGVGGESVNVTELLKTFTEQQMERDVENENKIEQLEDKLLIVESDVSSLEEQVSEVAASDSPQVEISTLVTKDELDAFKTTVVASTNSITSTTTTTENRATKLEASIINLEQRIEEASSTARRAESQANFANNSR